MIILHITPIGKVRMVRSDSWKQRPAVVRYWQYKDELVELAEKNGLVLGEVLENITFQIPMPASWSKKKKESYLNQPHKSKPDLDNILKAFQDCLLADDSSIHTFNNIRKVWAFDGAIIINT